MFDLLSDVFRWIHDNRGWFLSGLGLAILGVIYKVGRWLVLRRSSWGGGASGTAARAACPGSVMPANQTSSSSTELNEPSVVSTGAPGVIDLDVLKAKTHILFIDDDPKFKVVDILVKAGWQHTKKTRDVASIDEDKIRQAHILFIDIHGVGKKMQFSDEGLGIALAVRKKYPFTKIVIYSAEAHGDRFHPALRDADDILSKNADPYEFQDVTERLARELWARG